MKCSLCDTEATAKGLCGKHYKRSKSKRKPLPTRDMTREQKFLFYTTKTSSCWLWSGARFAGRYGAFCDGQRTVGAHTYSYKQFVGDIPKGMYVCHSCDTQHCVNPAHLFLGSPKDNTADMMKKGRGRWPSGTNHHLAKLSDEQVREIIKLKGSMTHKAIGDQYGVCQSHISRIMSGHKRGRKSSATP